MVTGTRVDGIIVYAICCARLLWELNGIEKKHPEQIWVKEIKSLLLEMKRIKATI